MFFDVSQENALHLAHRDSLLHVKHSQFSGFLRSRSAWPALQPSEHNPLAGTCIEVRDGRVVLAVLPQPSRSFRCGFRRGVFRLFCSHTTLVLREKLVPFAMSADVGFEPL